MLDLLGKKKEITEITTSFLFFSKLNSYKKFEVTGKQERFIHEINCSE